MKSTIYWIFGRAGTVQVNMKSTIVRNAVNIHGQHAMPGGNSQPLTERMIQDAKPAAGKVILWDSKLSGFGVRIQRSGLKSYVFRYRHGYPPRERLMTIARVGEVPLQAARDTAASIRFQARHDNLDPARMRLDLEAMRRELGGLAARVARLEGNSGG